MHHAMHPIKIGIVQKKHPDKCEIIIGFAVIGYIVIEIGVRVDNIKSRNVYTDKNAHGEH